MGDPLSIAASAAGLLSISLQSTEYLYNFYIAFRDQHQELARITDHLRSLLESLQIIDEILRIRTRRPSEQPIIQNIEASITRSKHVVRVLQDESNKFRNEPADNWTGKAVMLGRRAAYPFKRSTLNALGGSVNNFRDNVSVALQALQLKEHQKTQKDIEAVATIVKNLQAQNGSAALRQWLNPPDATIDFNIASAKRHMGTGQWLIDGTVYNAWLQQDNSLLWLYGFAGCGKSVLCSTVIQHTFNCRHSTDTAVAFFFFTFTDESKQDASAVLRALLFQLCSQISGLEIDLARLKESRNYGTPPLLILQEHLRQAVTQCRHVYILLDALDESPIDRPRSEVLTLIETMRQWGLPGLHLLVTSRDTPDIRSRMPFPALGQNVGHIVLKNESIQEDISKFVSFQVDHDRQLQDWGDYREEIKSYLTQHADGVFRWVECQLQPLRQCPRSKKHLQKYLHTLPKSLDETYERMLCGIESQEEAQKILSLLCYASRPLSTAEVIEALAVDVNELECYDPDCRLTAGADDLRRICPGLIEIDSSSHTDQKGKIGVNTSTTTIDVVRIAHFSVQEYLLSDRIVTSQAAKFSLSGPSQHGQISKTCLLYLDCDDFLQQDLRPELLERYAFAMYAAENWHHHYRNADSRVAEQLSDRVIRLLTIRHSRERWLRLHDPNDLSHRKVNYQNPILNIPSATYYSSLLGLDSVLMRILSVSETDINTQEGHYGSALQASLYNGHQKVVQLLLDSGADANTKYGWFGHTLQIASFCGHQQAVCLLLKKGADVHVESGWFGNALQAAADFGYQQVVQTLLKNGANVNTQGGRCGNALQAASRGGHENVVRMLLDNGAHVNTQGGRYGNALQAASFSGSQQVVQLLLDAGANVNMRGGCYGNALQAASLSGSQQVMRLLLDKAIDVHAQGGEHGSALQAAAFSGHREGVQLLLERGVDVNLEGGECGSPLLAALWNGHEHMVQLLLLNGATVNTQGGNYGNALQTASWNGHEQMVQMLLNMGLAVDIQGGRHNNALQVASLRGYKKVVQLLLNRGADVNAQGGEYGNALQAASYFDHEEIVQILVEKGANVNARGGEYGTALQAASVRGNAPIVQILLDNGADVHAQGGTYGNALQAAKASDHKKVVQMLEGGGRDGQSAVQTLRVLERATRTTVIAV